MFDMMKNKAAVRRQLKDALMAMSDVDRHRKSITACGLLARTPEFEAARVVMLYLSMPQEIDTAPLALKCWQAGKTVVVPKVSFEQRRMLPVEINSLQTGITTAADLNFREPIAGQPIPLDLIDLVIVPGLGFTPTGYRIGRGMGFYDRFLAQPEFVGVSCGLAFEEQVITEVPVLDHDMPLSMLVTDRGISRFATKAISQCGETA
ncbi:MAG TPA: 5-formyltetrahydrofolate cyclo-ligase [Tepidisphaeraceae bacterium]|nr:5-formyltetrahydrofolate cyclo-ligase [Tepidisphaeraceae bacterium]